MGIRAWLAAKLRLTAAAAAAAVLLALRLAELDQRFPGLGLTSTLLGGREAPDEPPDVVGLSMNLPRVSLSATKGQYRLRGI